MSTFYVWAAMDRAWDYREGDTVPNGEGAYLYAGDTREAARAAMVSDPATYETADGETARLYIAASGDDGTPRIVSGPHSGSAWPMPYAPKRYHAGVDSFVSLAGEFACERCGNGEATALDGGDLIVCAECI
jgi:hypothetical protein